MNKIIEELEINKNKFDLIIIFFIKELIKKSIIIY